MTSQRILLFTFLIHASWLLMLSIGGWSAPKQKKEKMVVVTKHYAPPKPIKSVAIITPIQSAPTPMAAPKKIVSKKKVPDKKPAEKKPEKKIAKKKAPTPSKQLLKKIDQTLTKIENPSHKITSDVATDNNSPPTFFDQVCHIFQQTLTLPEKGAVKLTLSVQPNGKIVIMELVHSENENNLQYLKLMLPMITLPPPEGGQEQTFMITFCND